MYENCFRFSIQRIPNTTFFCQEANLPEISLGVASKDTPFVLLKTPGDKVDFQNLTITFLVQEDMNNYTELFNWITGLGFPHSRDQFTELGSTADATNRGQYSDATLFITNSDNVPVMSVLFEDCFPTSLSIPRMSATLDSPGPVQATASFAFTKFTLNKLMETA
jgi:hypothetical protein